MKIIPKKHLTSKDLKAIAQLNSYYPDYAPYYESGANYGETCFFLAYEEDCIGFLSFLWVKDSDFSDEAELTAMVAPPFCHKQIFTALLKACRKECKKLGIRRLYFAVPQSAANIPAASKPSDIPVSTPSSAPATCEYSHSELLMKLTADKYAVWLSSSNCADPSADSIPAPYYVVQDTDRTHYTDMSPETDRTQDTGMSLETDAVQEQDVHSTADYSHIGQCTFILYNADANPMGFCNLVEEASFTNLWGVEINPSCRRQGLATALLSHVLKTYFAHTNKPLILQVGSRNLAALHLYQRLGFVIDQQIDYSLIR